MRSVLAFVAVNGFFIAVNLLAAGAMYALFRGAQALGLPEHPWVTVLLGALGIGCSLWLARWLLEVINRSSRKRRV